MTGIARSTAGWILASLCGVASAQGDGGSQTKCELQYSTCKLTSNADYQFCKTASEQGCQEKLDAALARCSAANDSCQLQSQSQSLTPKNRDECGQELANVNQPREELSGVSTSLASKPMLEIGTANLNTRPWSGQSAACVRLTRASWSRGQPEAAAG